jgi:hypothetical protein
VNAWNSTDARAIAKPEEVRVVTRRRDGSLRRPKIIWIVGSGNRVFVRSTNGRSADWFRHAIATGSMQVIAGGTTYDVLITEVDGDALKIVDAAYRNKYGRYRSIVDHLEGEGPRSATLEVHPA